MAAYRNGKERPAEYYADKLSVILPLLAVAGSLVFILWIVITGGPSAY